VEPFWLTQQAPRLTITAASYSPQLDTYTYIGVVQGSSVLGPVLFSQFMYDLPDILGDKIASKRWWCKTVFKCHYDFTTHSASDLQNK